MFKKTCLILIISTLSINGSEQFSSEVNVEQEITQYTDEITATRNTIKHLIDHINREEAVILLETKRVITLGKKALDHQKSLLGEEYNNLAQHIGVTISHIIQSKEFQNNLELITDYQAEHISNGICFNNLNLNDASLQNLIYDIDSVIDEELLKLAKELPDKLDEQIEHIFNTFYIVIAYYRGGALLIEKLTNKKIALEQELYI